MFNPWPLVAADLRRSSAGALAVVLLVALAVGLGVAVSAQERALRTGSARAADSFPVIVGARGSETQLVLSTVYLQPAPIELIPATILDELARRPDVAWAAPIAFGDSWRGHSIVGTTADLVTGKGRLAPAEGRVFETLDEVVVGAAVDLAPGDEIEPTHGMIAATAGQPDDEDAEHHDFHYRVVGRMPPLGTPWDHAIMAPVEALWWVHGLPVGHALNEARVWPDGPKGTPRLDAVPIGPPWTSSELSGIAAAVVTPASFAGAYGVRSAFRDAGRGLVAVFPAEVLVRLYGVLGDVRDLVTTISVLTQVMVIGAVLLAVLASLVQRRRLVGVLRALGASRSFVFSMTWLYVALLLFAGAALGLPLGWLGARLVAAIFEQRTALVLPVSLGRSELVLVVTVVLVGTLLATIPAAMALRGSIAAALRS